MEKKKLEVSAIKNGSVIDHIPADKVFDVVKILKLTKYEDTILIGVNFSSKRFTKKGVIKIKDGFFEPKTLSKISLLTPDATIVTIKNYKVESKKVVEVPEEVVGLVKCVNPKCITNHEEMTTKFHVINKEKIRLKCNYCEKITEHKEMEII